MMREKKLYAYIFWIWMNMNVYGLIESNFSGIFMNIFMCVHTFALFVRISTATEMFIRECVRLSCWCLRAHICHPLFRIIQMNAIHSYKTTDIIISMYHSMHRIYTVSIHSYCYNLFYSNACHALVHHFSHSLSANSLI